METLSQNNSVLNDLMKKGVRFTCPESVEIGSDVSPDRISGQGVTIHGGCRIHGAETLICEGVELGEETAATVRNCRIGKGVRLKGGFFEGSTFLDGVQFGSGAHVRKGCLLEEESRAAHCVGLKQTILLPFVTLGSLINFCDCLMAGERTERTTARWEAPISISTTPQTRTRPLPR